MRWVILLLSGTTLLAFFWAIYNQSWESAPNFQFSFTNKTDLFFLIALVGWMPAPLDISLWHSEWTLADAQSSSLKSKGVQLFDFNVGYWGTTLLAALFVGLGAMVIATATDSLPNSGVAFVKVILSMYTSTLGDWTYPIVATAALSCMLSTTFTVLDAYPRTLAKAYNLSFKKKLISKTPYVVCLAFTIIGAIYILMFHLESMKQLIDFATTISFISAPLLATLILAVVNNSSKTIFTKLDRIIAWIGLVFLYFFSNYFLWLKFF